MNPTPIRVLIIDDSDLVRDLLETGLNTDPSIEVVGKAGDVYEARDMIVNHRLDVITLDVEMPKMNGLEFLKLLMPQYPLPVILVSSVSHSQSWITIEALNHGAVDFIQKPTSLTQTGYSDVINDLIHKIHIAANVDVSHWHDPDFRKKQSSPSASANTADIRTNVIIAIGASTGGTQALTQIIRNFPPNMPGTIVVQHMPPVFTTHFANSLNKISGVEVKEARDGDRIRTGSVLIAPGGKQCRIIKNSGHFFANIYDGEKQNGFAPSVDVLFSSVAKTAGSQGIGVILTGMGTDGAKGLLAMRNCGAKTFAQDRQSCVVFGMPMEAGKIGAVDEFTPLDHITNDLVSYLSVG